MVFKKIINKQKYLFIFLVILLLVLISSLIFNFYNIYQNNKIIEKKQLHSELIISDKIGIAQSNNSLIFGGIKRNGSSTKVITLLNSYNENVNVEILKEGNISEFIYISENDFILKNGESKNITFDAISGPDAKFGKYVGEVYIVVKKV